MQGRKGGAAELARAMAAKSDPERSGRWLPLWMHGRDTAGVLRRLVQNWLPEAVRAELGLEEETLARVAVYLGLAHDLGKATALFQGKILRALPEARERLEAFLPLPEPCSYAGKSPHARASEAILLELGCPMGLACVAGAHHGKPQQNGLDDLVECQMEFYPRNYWGRGQEKQWRGAWEALHEAALRQSGFADVQELPVLTQPQEMLLTGLLSMADWIASNTTYFPLIPEEELGAEDAYPSRVDRGWRALHLTAPWESGCIAMEDDAFLARFGFPPNAMQREVLDAAAETAAPGIWILEAQMGAGKTEAALAAAEVFAARFQAGGLFFGLPTQATADGLFPRLSAWAAAQSQDMAHSFRLAHGAAQWNEAYAQMLEGRAITQEDEPEEGVWVHRWFQGGKLALLADFVLGTVDQLLLAALQQKYVMLRHVGLAGKVVIVDECHAYDAYMNEYLDRALNWLGCYRVPVLLLSATLPARRRAELVQAYLGGRAPEGDWKRSRGYPLLTWTEGERVRQRALPDEGKAREVRCLRIEEDGLVPLLREKLAQGGCAGVIVNTVKKAQEIALRLKEALPGFAIELLHAQMLQTDRAQKEERLRQVLGRLSTAAQRDCRIVVGTQVLEQSLDIDFDFLVTELCPMDLLLQRIGRLHRHARCRPELLRKAVCAVLVGAGGALDAGSRAVYGQWLLCRTLAFLPERLRLPSDIPRLVQAVYGWEEEECLAVPPEWEKAREEYQLAQDKRRARAKAYAISRPQTRAFDEATLEDLMKSVGAPSDAAALAAVRDGDPSLDVLVMMRDREGRVRFLPWQEGGRVVPTDAPPSREESLSIARQRLRLPGYFSKRWNIDEGIRELEEQNLRDLAEWQRAPLLKGELVLLLDAEMRAELAGACLRYDRELGLTYWKEEGD